MAIYRQGREEDLPEIVELLRGLVAESVYGGDPRFEFQEDDMRAHVKRFMDRAPRTLCAVCEDDGLCGVILADYCTMGFNRNVRSARENMLYVRKDHRGGMKGPRLMKIFMRWAKAIDAREILCGTNSGIDAKRTQELWLKLGSGLGCKELGFTVRGTL
jgi:L-amino acid N-acyltransferase YncA